MFSFNAWSPAARDTFLRAIIKFSSRLIVSFYYSSQNCVSMYVKENVQPQMLHVNAHVTSVKKIRTKNRIQRKMGGLHRESCSVSGGFKVKLQP